MQFRGISQATPEEMLAKFKAASAGNVQKADDTTRCLDPLTGNLITVEEFNSKYENGNALLQVYILVGNGVLMIEMMTANEYIQQYGSSTNPPRATIARNTNENDNPVTGGTYDSLKDMGLTDSEIEEYFDGPDTSASYSLKEGVTVGGKKIKSVDELLLALNEERKQKFKAAIVAGEIQSADDTSKCIDPLTGRFISVELFNQKFDNGKARLKVHIPRGNGMAMVEYMTAADYVKEYGDAANPPKAFLA